MVALCLVVMACGGDSQSGSGGGRTVEPCSLITVEEAGPWLGGPVDPPAPYDGPDPEPTCIYASAGAQTRILLQVYDGEEYYGGDNAELHPDAQPIDIGEKGYAESGTIGFVQNGWTVSITRISGPVTDESLASAARVVSSRLP